MGIVFFCRTCGARVEGPEGSAGRRGRCRNCGGITEIPAPREVAPRAANPGLAPVPRASDGAGSWIASASSSVGLAPLTAERLTPVPRRFEPKRAPIDDDLGDGLPYAVEGPAPRVLGGASPPVGALKVGWRRALGPVQKTFRRINQGAYLVSVPFLMLIVLGLMLRNRPLAILGATAVILLNLGRVAAGLANVVVVPFRDGPIQGLVFLVPPFTFVYMAKHWKALKAPTLRVVGPLATIAAVVLAFSFLPGLRRDGKAPSGGLPSTIVRGAADLDADVRDELGKAGDLEAEAAARLRSVGGKPPARP